MLLSLWLTVLSLCLHKPNLHAHSVSPCLLCSVGLVLGSVQLWNGCEGPIFAPGLAVSQHWGAQGQDNLLQAQIKWAADCWSIAFLWKPRKGRLHADTFCNGSGVCGGGNLGLIYISEKLWVESSVHCPLLDRHQYQTSSLFLPLPQTSEILTEIMDELIYCTAQYFWHPQNS